MIEKGISDLMVILIPYSALTAFITLTYASDIHILLSVINTIRLWLIVKPNFSGLKYY
jgi:hypothetical protein